MNAGWMKKEVSNSVSGWSGASWQARTMAMLLVATLGAGCSAMGGGSGDGSDMSEDPMAGGTSMDQFEASGTVSSGGPFTDVRFAFDSVEVDAGARAAISQNAAYLKEHSSVRAEIEGHCDERGTTEYNLALGARRAKTVRDSLIGLGISADRLSTVSYGEELPLCKDNTQACWGQNRRAHLVDLTK